jgi:hypothetical protein
VPVTISFDPNGRPHRDFKEIRNELITSGLKFTPRHLEQVRYEQLHLCAIANAGSAACDLEDVRREKESRRFRFLHASPDQIDQVTTFLKIEQMFDDVLMRRNAVSAPHWELLSDMQKLWFLLTCLHTHLNRPEDRLRKVSNLLFLVSAEGLMPMKQAAYMADLVQTIRNADIDPDDARMHLCGLAEEVLHMLSEDERDVCSRDLLLGYRCTSDCFQPTTSPQ